MKNNKIIYIVIGVVVIGAIGYGVYALVSKPKNDETKK